MCIFLTNGNREVRAGETHDAGWYKRWFGLVDADPYEIRGQNGGRDRDQ